MIVETKYDLGHVFYCPRSIKSIETEEIIVDGKKYVHTREFFKPVVNKKEIIRIVVHLTLGYKMANEITYVPDDDLGYVYHENAKDLAITEYETAKQIAEKYASEGKPFYGE